MAYDIFQSSTQSALLFLLVQSSDHITGLTGATPTVTISKNGAAFASPAGAVSEIGSGWYKVAGNATDTLALGPLALHATAAGADPCDLIAANIVAFNPQAALATPTNITAGTMTTVTNLTNAPSVGDMTATMKASVATAVLTTALIESYSALHAAPTLTQALLQLISMLQEKSVVSTVLTAKKLDGTTTAMVLNLNDPVSPTQITRTA